MAEFILRNSMEIFKLDVTLGLLNAFHWRFPENVRVRMVSGF